MKAKNIIALILLCSFLFSPVSIANAKELATFESFYKESETNKWLLAGGVALGTVALVYFTGGLGSVFAEGPIAYVGTLIGKAAGYSGIAATNYGLALLGGGSIASGGYGMALGSAVLSGAFTFTGKLVEEKISDIVRQSNYEDLCEATKKLPKLPLPINDSGPSVIEDAFEALKDKYDNEKPPADPDNYASLQKAITELAFYKDNSWTETGKYEKSLRVSSTISLLAFIASDYTTSTVQSNKALYFINKLSGEYKASVPLFVHSISAYLQDRITSVESINEFGRAVTSENDDALLYTLLSIYIMHIREKGINSDIIDGYSDIVIENVNDLESAQALLCMLLTYALAELRQYQQTIINFHINFSELSKHIGKQKIYEESSKCINNYFSILNGLEKVLLKPKIKKDYADKSQEFAVVYSEAVARYNDYKKFTKELEVMVNEIKKALVVK